MIALRGSIRVACFIIHVSQGRLAMPQDRRELIEARHVFFLRSEGGTCEAASAGDDLTDKIKNDRI